jgi:hypothetical protein
MLFRPRDPLPDLRTEHAIEELALVFQIAAYGIREQIAGA